jgi:hypothetical protein
MSKLVLVAGIALCFCSPARGQDFSRVEIFGAILIRTLTQTIWLHPHGKALTAGTHLFRGTIINGSG